jgi:hypothetical protein
MIYPAIVTGAIYLSVSIGDRTGLQPMQRYMDPVAGLALNISVIINMSGIGFVTKGILWALVPPKEELLFGNRFVFWMRLIYAFTAILAFILLWIDPFDTVSRYQV